jgi:hypothetical protein
MTAVPAEPNGDWGASITWKTPPGVLLAPIPKLMPIGAVVLLKGIEVQAGLLTPLVI